MEENESLESGTKVLLKNGGGKAFIKNVPPKNISRFLGEMRRGTMPPRYRKANFQCLFPDGTFKWVPISEIRGVVRL
jgi:hypothetical protein